MDIALFTESYPLGGITEEAFVLPELGVLARAFENVFLVPVSSKGSEVDSWRVADNIYLEKSYANSDIACVNLISVLARPWLWLDCVFHRSEVRRKIEYCHFRRWMRAFMREERLSSERVLCYSFWLTQTAEYIGMYAKTSQGRAVARAHRFDIYDMPNTTFRRNALQGLSAIFPCSEDGVNEVRTRYPELKERVEVSYLGVGKPHEKALNPSSTDPERLTFFSCHSLIQRKRGALCAQMLIQLAAEMPDKTIRWILVGDGEERTKIEALADSALGNFVLDMRGALPNAAVHKIYETEHIDIAVLLSTSEGLAVMDQEALSYGIPVIGTDVGGTRECVSCKTGALLPVTLTFEMFRESVKRILSDNVNYSREAFETYRRLFDVTKTRPQFVDKIKKH